MADGRVVGHAIFLHFPVSALQKKVHVADDRELDGIGALPMVQIFLVNQSEIQGALNLEMLEELIG